VIIKHAIFGAKSGQVFGVFLTSDGTMPIHSRAAHNVVGVTRLS